MRFPFRNTPVCLLFWLVLQVIPSSGSDTECWSVITEPNGIRVSLDCSGYHITAGDTIFRLAIDGVPSMPVGPDVFLPSISLLAGIPCEGTCRIERVTATWQDLPAAVSGKLPDGLPDGHTPVEMGKDAFIRDQRTCPVLVRPAAVDPFTRAVRLATALSFSLVWDTPTVSAAAPVYPSGPMEDVLRKRLINYSQALAFRKPPQTVGTYKTASLPDLGDHYCIIHVDRDDMYRITYDDLETAGIGPATVEPRTFRLFHGTDEIPLRVTGEADGRFDRADAVIFYGEFARGRDAYYSPFTSTNVYYLTWGGGPGKRIVSENATPAWIDVIGLADREPEAFRDILFYEEQTIFDRTNPTLTGNDYYFWKTIGEPDRSYLYLDIPSPADVTDECRIRIGLQGKTERDHRYLFYVNGTFLGDTSWSGASYVEFNARPVATGHLGKTDTLAELLIAAAGDNDLAYIDWVEVDYLRQYRARDNGLAFTGYGGTDFTDRNFYIDGFTTDKLELFDTGGRRLTDFVVRENGERNDTLLYRVFFRDRIADTVRYRILPADGFGTPADIQAGRPLSGDLTDRSGIPYVIITHRDFAEAAESLKVYRSQHGLAARVYYVDEIYHYYTAGTETPEALKDFLADAYATWQTAPQYVLLLGDATYNYSRSPYNFVPTYLVKTPSWGMTASDNWFACVSGDDWLPDLAIGRLPARTAQEAMAMVRKTIRYETADSPGTWERHVLLTAGGDESKNWEGGDFTFFVDQSEELERQYLGRTAARDKEYTVRVPGLEQYNHYVVVDGDTVPTGKQQVLDYLDEGRVLVNFVGHGGGSVWADKDLLRMEDVARLGNGDRLPLVFSLTCFTGFFDNPSNSSLGEEMIKAPQGGAVGFIGASGYGWAYGDYYFDQQLFSAVFTQDLRRFGAILNSAKIDMHAFHPGWEDRIIAQYALLGDPAVSLRMPVKDIALTLGRPAVVPTDTLVIDGTVPDVSAAAGTLLVEVYSAADSLLDRTESVLAGNGFRQITVLPAGTDPGKGTVRVFYRNGTDDAWGAVTFQVNAPFVGNFAMEPEQPGHLDSVYLAADLGMPGTVVDSAYCYWRRYQQETGWHAIILTAADTAGNRFRTSEPVVAEEGVTIEYRMSFYYDGGLRYDGTDYPRYYVARRADLSGTGPVLVSGDSTVQLGCTVYNAGEQPAAGISVRFYTGTESSGTLLGSAVSTDTVHPGGEQLVLFDLPDTLRGRIPVTAVIDPDSLIEEISDSNNVVAGSLEINLFRITPAAGSAGPVSTLDSNLAVSVDPGVVTVDRVMNLFFVAESLSLDGLTQPDFSPAPFRNGTPGVYRAQMTGDDAFSGPGLAVTFYYDASDSAILRALAGGELVAARYDSVTGMWRKTAAVTDTLQACLRTVNVMPGLVTLLYCRDELSPELEMTVEGQGFADGDFVTGRPVVGIVCRDGNGVSDDSVMISLDGEPLPDDVCTRTYGDASGYIMTVSCEPVLDAGTHLFKVGVFDNALNYAEQEYSMVTADRFDIRFAANHPNPFWDETSVAFSITGLADRLTVKIYTAGGRLIRTIRRSGIIGYDEIVWDATDDDERPVANGVYYLKLIAEQGNTRVERKLKVAYLRR